MSPLTRDLINCALVNDTGLTPAERECLGHYLQHGAFKFIEVEAGPLLLPAIHAAKYLGISPESFKKIRNRAAILGRSELCGIETTPGTVLFQRHVLAKFSRGEIDLHWNAKYPPQAVSTAVRSAIQHLQEEAS